MRIMILANNDVGLYKFRRELITELLKDNEVIIVVPYGDYVDSLTNLGCSYIDIPVDRRGTNPIKDFKLYRMYKKGIKKYAPDLVITYTIKPNVYGGIACRILKTPYVVNITGMGTAFEDDGILKRLVSVMNKVACKKARTVFFENEENKRAFIDAGIVKENQTYRLFGAGVNLNSYPVIDYPNGDAIRFLFMGRVMAEKGIDELFIAMRRLIGDGVKCKLDIVGGYEENYEEKMRLYESEGWLTYYGYQKDVRPYIAKCHCFVLPSWHEGMANTNLESAASGRPVITSNIPGCREAVIDGKSGFLVERKDCDSLYEALKKFSIMTYDERRRMGLEGRKHMEGTFDKFKVVSETIAHL